MMAGVRALFAAAALLEAAAAAACEEDNHPSCAGWADLGECQANPGWMLPNCARSCGDGSTKALDCLAGRIDNSWLRDLNAEPGHERHAPNQRAREVRSGHYVHVVPTPLPDPVLVACSNSTAALLGLGIGGGACRGDPRFVRLFSGDVNAVPGFKSWATPYALSIYGSPTIPRGAGPNGDGYGDGRALSIAEVLIIAGGKSHDRWELQLKGAGATPFCRNADGRAVLRSSVREFLASEAMFHLGVPTTRALSLVASTSARVRRPWYSATLPGEDDDLGVSPTTAPSPSPDIQRWERCAICCRVARSFLRVGHFELFGRRARAGKAGARRELEQLARHALAREYRDHHRADAPDAPLTAPQLLGMLGEAARRFAHLAAEWIRVGYAQSNFNSDNCLMGGETVDYGPFGFIEAYAPDWGMWISSGQHFSFMNQPAAAGENFRMLAESLEPLLDAEGKRGARAIVHSYDRLASEAVDGMLARKLGFRAATPATRALWKRLERMLRQHPTDWTLMWRQLARAVLVAEEESEGGDGDAIISVLNPAFYEQPLASRGRAAWKKWLTRWRKALRAEDTAGGGNTNHYNATDIAARLRAANPKYIPREWMLAEAYTAAEAGDYSGVHALQKLFRRPYAEQEAFAARYYRRAPDGAAETGGIGFMS